MKKGILLALLAVGLGAAEPAADLASVYRKGRITLAPDRDFAQGADWEELFPTRPRAIAVAADGSVFVSNQRDHKIYKFGPDGALLKTFGKKGQGPGDFQFPSELSVLDDAYLVVGEFMEGRRISLFKLDGAFHAVYKTDGPPSSPMALRNGKIAYVALTGTLERQGDEFVDVNMNRVMVLDTTTGRSRQVALIKTSVNAPRDGEAKIGRSAEGDLLVGHTIRPELEIFSPDGVRKGVIELSIDRLPVTKKIAENHQVRMVYNVGGKSREVVRPMGDFLPYYADFTVDAEGNILVFKMNEDPKSGRIVFQVYAPEGRILCETELDRGGFDLPLDRDMRPRLAFTDRGVYGLLPFRGDEYETHRLFRVRY
jgi:hypothetical protein